jgi:hypothetical protein
VKTAQGKIMIKIKIMSKNKTPSANLRGEKQRQVAAVHSKDLSNRLRDAAGNAVLPESRSEFVPQDARPRG